MAQDKIRTFIGEIFPELLQEPSPGFWLIEDSYNGMMYPVYYQRLEEYILFSFSKPPIYRNYNISPPEEITIPDMIDQLLGPYLSRLESHDWQMLALGGSTIISFPSLLNDVLWHRLK